MAWGLLPYVHDIVSNSGPLCRPRALCPVVLERRPWATMRVTYPVPSRNVSRSFVLLDASLMKVPLITWARKRMSPNCWGVPGNHLLGSQVNWLLPQWVSRYTLRLKREIMVRNVTTSGSHMPTVTGPAHQSHKCHLGKLQISRHYLRVQTCA